MCLVKTSAVVLLLPCCPEVAQQTGELLCQEERCLRVCRLGLCVPRDLSCAVEQAGCLELFVQQVNVFCKRQRTCGNMGKVILHCGCYPVNFLLVLISVRVLACCFIFHST